jgi:5'-3' exonuclease
MLLDTASLYFRAFYGVPTSVTAPNGAPVNAARGLLDFISRLVTDHRPTDLIAAWDDDWRPEFRVAAIPSYKAHRVAESAEPELDGESVPDELLPQVELIENLLRAAGIARLGMPGYEADDVIGSLASQTSDPVLVVTGDRDLFQLVDDTQPIRVLYTAAKGVGNAEVIDDAAVYARYGVHANEYAEFALLRGDPSDGLPGVRGIGEKTAANLIREYSTIGNLLEAAEAEDSALKPGVRKNLLAGRDYIAVAGPVVEVARGIKLPKVDSGLPSEPASVAELRALTEEWGLTSAVERLAAALGWTEWS